MAGDDVAYAEWLRRRPCAGCSAMGVEVHHRTGAGMALRASDRDAMPLCRQCHHDFHAAAGRFRAMGRQERAAWQDEQIARHRQLYEGQLYVDEWLPF